MTNTSRSVRHAVRIALAACATTATVPLAYGQATPPPAAPAAEPAAVQEVVVTGSRIAQAPNDISISPVTSVTSVDIQQTGLVRTEDILNNLPQVVAEQGSGTSISSNGTATVSLRGMGSNRTLVLVNGRRMNPGGSGGVSGTGSNANGADINQIPADLIERVDVLTGGASSVYGADAVAGVVNFVLNTHYEGVRIDADYAFNNHKNDNQMYLGFLRAGGDPLPPSTVNTGQDRNLSFLVGSNFADGKGNATAYATYLNQSPAVGYQFDHAGCTLNGPGKATVGQITCGGSGTSAHGQFIVLGVKGTAVTSIVDNAVDPTTGAFRPYSPVQDDYNYGALSYFQRAAERWTAGGFLHYDVTDHVSVYSETMFARNTSTAQYGPSGDFFQTSIVQCNDPLLTAQEVATLCSPATLASNHMVFPNLAPNQVQMYIARRSVESGGRQDNYISNSIRQLIGTKGDIIDAWTYDAYAQVGITQFQDIESDFLGIPQITNALDAVPNPPVAAGGIAGVPTGAPVCQAALTGAATNCVPWNVWKPNSVTPAQLAYLSTPATYSSNSTEYLADASATGDLGKYGVKLPTANNGMSVNVGAEYREEKFNFNPDFVFLNGLQAGGAPSKTINGEFRVWEGFTELRLPLIDEKPGAYLVSVDAGYRYSSYSLGFNTNTYKFGVEWAPIQDVRFRGGYNRAVRAPNIDELYAPPAVGAGGTADPCWGSTPILTLAQCEKAGVLPGQYGHILVNSAAQINTQTSGLGSLTPELADTYTFGIVFQPQFIPGFVMSIDAFNIKIKNEITSLSSNTIIVDCGTGIDPALCDRIHRGPTGSLWLNTTNFVDATNANIGAISTRGADLAAHYQLNVGPAGKLGVSLGGTYTKDFQTEPVPGGPEYDCAGFWGSTCGPPVPHWRHVLNLNWGLPWAGLDLTARWRFVGPSLVDRASSNPQLQANYYVATAHIPGYNYIDLSASMPILSNFDIRVGVNNLADKNPPLILNGTLSDCPNNTCNDNTWVGTYDTLGRYLYAHVSVKF